MRRYTYSIALERRKNGLIRANLVKVGWKIEVKDYPESYPEKGKPTYPTRIGVVGKVTKYGGGGLGFVVDGVDSKLYGKTELVKVIEPDLAYFDLSNFGYGRKA